MSEPNEQPDPHDEARDRLTDRILAEALGAESPPDLSDAIASRLDEAQSVPHSTEEKTMQSRRAWMVLLTTAASLMLGVIVWGGYEQRKYEAEIARLAEQELREAEQDFAVHEQQVAQLEGELEEVTESLSTKMEAYQRLAKDSGASAAYSGSFTPETKAKLKELNELQAHKQMLESMRRQFGHEASANQGNGSAPLAKLSSMGRSKRQEPRSEARPVPTTAPTPSYGVAGSTRARGEGVKSTMNRLSLAPGDIVDTRKLSDSERSIGGSSVFNTTPALGKPPQSAYVPSPEVRARLNKQAKQSSTGTRFRVGEAVNGDAGVAGEASRADKLWFSQIDSRSKQLPERRTFGYYDPNGRKWPEPPSSDRYEPIHENDFITPRGGDALSTFSIDVDTASYSNVRRFLMESRRLPDPNAVRIEELVNYFEYDYAAPEAESEDPFAASLEVGYCPWNSEHRLVRIGIKGREIDAEKRPLSNLVFLVDVSGSMQDPNKLPLVIEGLKALTDKLGENDRVAIAVYAGNEGLVLPSTSGVKKDEIRSALGRLTAGGSTAGGAGLKLAYEIAERNQIVGGVNRVVLCTDGDFNVGLTGTEELAALVETRAKETGVFLTVLGFGSGNLNDAMLEAISGRGDGHYAYIDSESEARRVLSRDLSGTLVTIAKDVKIQLEFNPAKVASYRLIGYENRVMAAEDFNDDTKDAGEIGAGHTVTALYEVVPVGVEPPAPPVDGLKYQPADGSEPTAASDQMPTADSVQLIPDSNEMLTLKIRYKQPEGGASKKIEFPLEDPGADARLQESIDFRWAASVAEFGMLLRNSRHRGEATFEHVLESARSALGEDPHGYRSQMLDLVRRAQELSKGVRR